MGITKFVLKRPVTVIMTLLCLLVFGISSVFHASLEQMPEMETPMMTIMARCEGAGPEDISELVTEPIEDAVSTLEGVKSISSSSSDGSARIMLEYDYGTDMDEAYNELTKKMSSLERQLPEDMDTPTVMEMGQNAGTSMMLSISHKTETDLYSYAEQKIVPELEKIASVASVEAMGGTSEYIQVELNREKMDQYKVTMSQISSAIQNANVSLPSGDTISGNLELSVTTSLETSDLEELKNVPVTASTGEIIRLQDVADVRTEEEKRGGISRYDGEETISISVMKNQSNTDIEVSEAVRETIKELQAADPDLTLEVVNDTADTILDSLKDVAETMALSVIISMIIIFLFFGDLKASLIVGSSIPTSILLSLIAITAAGFSLNVITMSALVLGVGMMVDNSIVVLESCFRAAESNRDKGIFGYAKAALLGSNQVLASIIGGTATTCVVFLPLAAVQGMSGQMFGPLGYTVVFCMLASLLSAITVVPLCYVMYKPQEKSKAFMSRPVERLQNFYRKVMKKLLRHKGRVMAVSATMLAATFYLASGMRSELITSDDTGQINIEIETRPGLLEEKTDDALARIEEIVSSDENVESYMLRYQNQSGSVTAYLKDDRTEDTDQLAEQWQQELSDIENISAEVTAGSSMSFMQRTRGYETILTGTDYEELKEVSDQIVSELISRDDVINIHSSFENNAPIVSIDVDPLMASRKGLTASSIGSAVNQTLSGMTAAVLTVDGEDLDVKVEFPEGEYATIDQMKNIILTAGDGTATALTDVADIVYKDSPSSISREDKAFKVTITGEYTGEDTSAQIDSEVIAPNLTGTIKKGTNSMNRMMNEEFSSLYQAIAVAVFLIFVVMAAQFESVKFSFMVMTTIPFSLIGSFGFLKLTGVSMSMTSILGFLILVGTVVNNGILYVDTVNQYRMEMDMETAMIEAGATRLRPMLMTSLTTILGMIPMAAAMGSSGSTTQGLAIVDIGGLTVGLFVALFMLPVYYGLMNRKPREINEDWDID